MADQRNSNYTKSVVQNHIIWNCKFLIDGIFSIKQILYYAQLQKKIYIYIFPQITKRPLVYECKTEVKVLIWNKQTQYIKMRYGFEFGCIYSRFGKCKLK